ncbi:MAG: hypothetical protein ACM3N4_00520 [Nitrososphaerota archaeon]
MKPTGPRENHRQADAPRRRSRRGITRIALAGGIAAVIVGAAVEALAALVTEAWPSSGTVHLVAALLALVIGCIVTALVALRVLVHGVEGTVNRIGASVRTLSTSVAGAAGAAKAIEQQRKPLADTGESRPSSQQTRAQPASNALSGLLAGVESDGARLTEPVHDAEDAPANARRRASEVAPMR